jgi:sigma-E factor negative regulatory protein RseA
MMNDDGVKNQALKREMVCALADGQLRGQDFADTVESVHSNLDARTAWQSYHVIGDVLRSPELAQHAGDNDFLARFQSRLAADVSAQAAYRGVRDGFKGASLASDAHDLRVHSAVREASANESAFAWKLAAGFASLAAVVAIGWSMTNGFGGSADGAQLARAVSPGQTSSTVLAGSEPAVMIRDPNLDALMAAHKQFGGTTALQMPTGFLRNATFEGAAR